MAETKRVIYYDQLSGNQPTNGDVIFVDNPNTGTHKMDLKSFVDAINNGFDSSIKSSGVSVSADNYSSIITNVNDQPVNSIYTYGAGLQSKVTNLPSNKAMTIINFAQKSTGGLGQVMLAVERNGSDDYLYFRTIGGSPAVWSSWVKVANNSDVEAVREALDNLDIETDKTLSVDGKPADAKATGDEINSLKADFNQSNAADVPFIESKLKRNKSLNLFDITKAVSGIVDTSGNISASTNYKTSDYIPVTAGDTIKSYYQSGQNIYTANMRYICAYDESKNPVSEAGISSQTNTYVVPSGISYIRFSASAGVIDSNFMVIVGMIAPTLYIPYDDYFVATDDFISKALSDANVATMPITKEKTDFWHVIKSINLFNKNDIVSGKYFNPNSVSLSDASSMFAAYVKINGSGTYSFYADATHLGESGAKKIHILNSNKTYIKTLTATTEETSASTLYLINLTISDADISDGAAYIGYSQKLNQIDQLMVVKSATYPSEYTQYYEYWELPDLKNVQTNPLFAKKVVFDGDSICAGNGSAMGDYGNGWAGRIGVDNNMEWYNVGVSGACITAETYFNSGTPRHWVSRYIDTIHTNYPDADYIIAEGGTNDADNFYNTPEKLGTFSETDFTGPFDDTTFYGAMDSWCKKAMTYFPKAKIGFIIAHKMGLGFVGYTKNRYDYFSYAERVCKKWGIPVINLWVNGQLRPDVESNYNSTYNTIETATEHGYLYYDGQHLTAYGYDIISPKIAEWMKSL